ncbi:MAG: nucleotidyltransferase domain-containing protein [Myxococcales bacterium]|nr:nucleotidyltransferase domain-containing protein [Myxococcales bacterium]
MSLDEVIAKLEGELARDERIAAAILFGSAATGKARPGSDLDVAIVGRSDGALASLCDSLLDLTGRLTIAVGRDVQLVLLEKAPPVLGHQVLKFGRVLFDRLPRRTANAKERILSEYFDTEFLRRTVEAGLALTLQKRRDG